MIDYDVSARHLEALQNRLVASGYLAEVVTDGPVHGLALRVARHVRDTPTALPRVDLAAQIDITCVEHLGGYVYMWPHVIGIEPLGPVERLASVLQRITEVLGPTATTSCASNRSD